MAEGSLSMVSQYSNTLRPPGKTSMKVNCGRKRRGYVVPSEQEKNLTLMF